MRAYSLIRDAPFYRKEAFHAGLEAIGYQVDGRPRGTPSPGDVLLIWNKYGMLERFAADFRAARCATLVVENGLMGRDVPGGPWYSMALDNPAAGGGTLQPPVEGEDRVAAMGIEYGEWRQNGKEIIVLEQRGIGPPGIASPTGWTEATYKRVRAQTSLPVRIRRHPGENACVPLEQDLQHAAAVVTWGSGAALKALALGIPVFYCLKSWIGAPAAKQWTGLQREFDQPRLDEAARARVFEAVARACWRIEEIRQGIPMQRLVRASPYFRSETTPAAALPARRSTPA